MLRDEDWLAQAQRLSIGMQMRVHHGRERRPNMIIKNDKDRWWSYCQACKEGGVLLKQHVVLSGDAPEITKDLALPTDYTLAQPSEYGDAVGIYLHSKNMAYPYLPPVFVSPTAKRMLLRDDAGLWHGRDLTNKSDRKWLNYQHAKFVGLPSNITVITEDLFSMYKMRYALGVMPSISVCCTLGASVSSAAALALKDCKRLIYAYDADKAGDAGFVQGYKRMKVFGMNQERFRPPEGLDPKDMQCWDIRNLITEVLQ